MLMPFNEIQQAPQKVDICFYNAFNSHLNNYKCQQGFFIVRTIVVGWFLVSHFINNNTDDQNIYSLVSILFTFLIIFNIAAFAFSNWTYRNYMMDSKRVNGIAQAIQHSKTIEEGNPEQLLQFYKPIQNLDLKVSKTIYQFQNNILESQIDTQYKSRAQRNCLSLLYQSINMDKWVKFWNQTFNLVSIAIFTYTIVLLSQGKGLTPAEISFLTCYLFTEVCSRFFIYFILLVVGLSPLCCIGFCVYVCCFKKQIKIQLPPSQQATLDIVKQCEGNCPICFQSINIKEQVVVLRCSPKHVFHDLCIKGWTGLRKNTCPVCRAQI